MAAVAIVGIPDARTGERAVACVVLKTGQTCTFDDMRSALDAAGLARHKFPEALEIMQALPLNTIGKVLKEDLKARLSRTHVAEPER